MHSGSNRTGSNTARTKQSVQGRRPQSTTTTETMSELDDLASPLTKLRVNPIPNEFGAYQGEAGPSRYALRDPGVTPSRREVCPRYRSADRSHQRGCSYHSREQSHLKVWISTSLDLLPSLLLARQRTTMTARCTLRQTAQRKRTFLKARMSRVLPKLSRLPSKSYHGPRLGRQPGKRRAMDILI
jgi:hypothetical protein